MLIDHVQLVGTAYSTHDAVSYIVLSLLIGVASYLLYTQPVSVRTLFLRDHRMVITTKYITMWENFEMSAVGFDSAALG